MFIRFIFSLPGQQSQCWRPLVSPGDLLNPHPTPINPASLGTGLGTSTLHSPRVTNLQRGRPCLWEALTGGRASSPWPPLVIGKCQATGQVLRVSCLTHLPWRSFPEPFQTKYISGDMMGHENHRLHAVPTYMYVYHTYTCVRSISKTCTHPMQT